MVNEFKRWSILYSSFRIGCAKQSKLWSSDVLIAFFLSLQQMHEGTIEIVRLLSIVPYCMMQEKLSRYLNPWTAKRNRTTHFVAVSSLTLSCQFTAIIALPQDMTSQLYARYDNFHSNYFDLHFDNCRGSKWKQSRFWWLLYRCL